MPTTDDDAIKREIIVDRAVSLDDAATECLPEFGLTERQLQILKIAGCDVADFSDARLRHPARSYDYARLRGEGIKHVQAMAVLSSRVSVAWYLAHKRACDNMTPFLGQSNQSDGLAFRLGIAPADDRLFPQFTTVGVSRSTPNLLWPESEISTEVPCELRPAADGTDALFCPWSDQLSGYATRGSVRPQRDQWTYIKGFKRMPVGL